MADTPATNGGGAQAQPSPDQMPSLNALAQYAKDFSFENPNAPRSLTPQQQGPTINIQVNVNAKQLADTDFEIDLKLEGDGKVGNEVLFAFDLTYSGVFRARNIPQEQLHPVIMIECPRLLFPFARQIVADAVRNGGFPPLYIDPIDFVALYRQKAAEQGQAAPGQPGPAMPGGSQLA
jgi:preprotein translocase subunit SecB